MNLLEFTERAQQAPKRQSRFEFRGATFSFKPLGFQEMHVFAPFAAVSKEAKSITESGSDVIPSKEALIAMVTAIDEVIKINAVLGWENLTVGLFKQLSNLEIEDPDDAIIPSGAPEENTKLVRLMIANAEFAMFIGGSAVQATSRLTEQKKS